MLVQVHRDVKYNFDYSWNDLFKILEGTRSNSQMLWSIIIIIKNK